MTTDESNADFERAVVFECEGEQLMGLLHDPGRAGKGVLFVAGGGQYRAGSHRLYVQLARNWQKAGHAVFRFDQRGVGDSDGRFAGFERISADISAAAKAFRAQCPDMQQLYVLGLCDGAAAALLSVPVVDGVNGLVLINPWVHSSALEARTRLSRYYTSRLKSRDFWSKFGRGRLDLGSSARSLSRYLRDVLRDIFGPGSEDRSPIYVNRMLKGLQGYSGRSLFVLSGQDLVAQQFRQLVTVDGRWKNALDRDGTDIANFEGADHTFSYRVHREQLEQRVLAWLS